MREGEGGRGWRRGVASSVALGKGLLGWVLARLLLVSLSDADGAIRSGHGLVVRGGEIGVVGSAGGGADDDSTCNLTSGKARLVD